MTEELTPEQEARLEEVYTLEREAYQLDLKNELEAAFALKREALALEETILGPNHAYLATAMDTLAIDLYHSKHFNEAEALFRRALAIYKSAKAPVFSDLASSYLWLSFVYDDQKQWRKALAYWQEVLRIRKRMYQGDLHSMVQTLEIYADLLRVTGRNVRAKAMLKRAKRFQRKRVQGDNKNAKGNH